MSQSSNLEIPVISNQNTTDSKPKTLKLKVVKDKDIRIFKYTSTDSMTTILNNLNEFVSKSFQLKIGAFHLQFLDYENDLVTLIDEDDLLEVLESKKKSNITPKVFVIQVKSTKESPKNESKPKVEEKTDNTQKTESVGGPVCICGAGLVAVEARAAYGNYSNIRSVECDVCAKVLKGTDIVYHCVKGKETNVHLNGYDVCKDCAKALNESKNQTNGGGDDNETTDGGNYTTLDYHSFVNDLNSNESLKTEFENFLSDFIMTLKTTSKTIKQAFLDNLNKYKLLKTHKMIKTFIKTKLDQISMQFSHLAKFIVSTIQLEANSAVLFLDMLLKNTKNECKNIGEQINQFFLSLTNPQTRNNENNTTDNGTNDDNNDDNNNNNNNNNFTFSSNNFMFSSSFLNPLANLINLNNSTSPQVPQVPKEPAPKAPKEPEKPEEVPEKPKENEKPDEEEEDVIDKKKQELLLKKQELLKKLQQLEEESKQISTQEDTQESKETNEQEVLEVPEIDEIYSDNVEEEEEEEEEEPEAPVPFVLKDKTDSVDSDIIVIEKPNKEGDDNDNNEDNNQEKEEPKVVVKPKQPKFRYESQLEVLKSMGFEIDEKVAKELLVKYRGSIEQVVHSLFGN